MTQRIRGLAGAAALAALFASPAALADSNPIKIGVIAENQAVAGSSIPLAAQIAADEINAKGGVDGRQIQIVAYDDHSSSAEAVRAFQRAVSDDHVIAVIASYTSEVVLALEPWAARLKTVMITPGAASDVIITGISHVGVQPTVQWKSSQVPIPMFGVSSQATNSTFWKDTNGATEGVLYQAVSGPGVAVTEKTLPFVDAFVKKYGNTPSYAGYTAYDDVYMIADAVKRAGATDSDKLVAAMEATDYVGTIGR